MVSSCLNIIVDLTQQTDFTFNYFTAKNCEHYQNFHFLLATLQGFLNQNPQRELQGM